MGKQSLIRELDLASMKKTVPNINTGYTVEITEKIKEGDKERNQIFKGLVIKTHGKGDLNSTITIRKISEGIGVEKVFSLHSPVITDIKIVKIAKVRRSKLYYLRDRFGKAARLQETQITESQRDKLVVDFAKSKTPAPQIEEPEIEKIDVNKTELTETAATPTDLDTANENNQTDQ